MTAAAAKLNVEKIKVEDLAKSGGAPVKATEVQNVKAPEFTMVMSVTPEESIPPPKPCT